MRPFFSFHIPSFTFQGVPDDRLFEHALELARAADSAGFDMVTVMDHFYQIEVVGSEDEPMLEAYTALGALAASTSRVKLGAMVTGVTYRNPAMLAKIVTTLDVISGGRAVLGIGAAWNESEHQGYGFEFPPIGEREDRLEEALAICKAMFTEERPTFRGRYYTIERALNVPRPIQPGGPQIMVGGGGEKRTLLTAARYADITNWCGSLDDARRKLAVLDEHCKAVGRDPSSILRTISVPFVPVENEAAKRRLADSLPPRLRQSIVPVTVEEGAAQLGPYMEAGFGGFMFRDVSIRTPEAVALAGELISRVRSEAAVA